MDFIDGYGLTNSRKDEVNAENALLWTLEHLLLEELSGDIDPKRIMDINKAMHICKIEDGIYAQNPHFKGNPPAIAHDAYMSPDQLVAFFGASKRFKWGFGADIWKEMKRQGVFRYDNINPEKPKRFMHPKHVAFFAICQGSWIGYLLMPFLCLAMIWSCNAPKEKTSGKLLVWTKTEVLKEYKLIKLTRKICDKLIEKRNGNWKEVFAIYFKDEDHPIRHLADRIY